MKQIAIQTEQEYNRAMDRLEQIFDAEPGTCEGEELETLGILIDEYEKINFPLFLTGVQNRKNKAD